MAARQAQVYHNLAILLEAGVPLVRSLRTAGSGPKGPLQRALLDLAEVVSQGHTLAEAMSRHPKLFSRLDILLVETGETSGSLPETLSRLSEWYELRLRLKRTMGTGMLLPVLVYGIAALVIPFPQFFLGHLTSSQYLWRVNAILAVMYVPALLILAIVRLTPEAGPLRKLLDGFTLKIPVVGLAFRQLALSRFLRAFHLLYKAGVPISRCVELSAGISSNAIVAQWLRSGADSAMAGRAVSEGFSRNIPKDILNAWESGEESGQLDEVTERLAQIATERCEHLFVELSKWIPRIIYFAVCIWVAIQIVTMYAGIFSARTGFLGS